jgi:uncharacterized protein (TIGR02466 family)
MPLQHLFPTLFYNTRLSASPVFQKQLLKEAYVFMDLDQEGKGWSKENYPAGYTSYSSMDNLMQRSPYYQDLQKKIDSHALKFAKNLELDLAGKKLMMTSMWVNIMGKLSHHSFHLHPLSVISGTYYLKTPKGCGEFKVEDPRIQSFMASPRKSKTSQVNSRYVSLTPKAGQLVLFESWLKHEVTANLSSDDRVSVSFNYSLI